MDGPYAISSGYRCNLCGTLYRNRFDELPSPSYSGMAESRRQTGLFSVSSRSMEIIDHSDAASGRPRCCKTKQPSSIWFDLIKFLT